MAWTDKLAEILRLNDAEKAYVGYPQMQVGLNKPRKAGYATGFLEGATGMDSMQPKNPITDPNYESYEQGKNIGEAVGIGAMAIPGYVAALKAGAPKAYNALENYMIKSGGMIPLEAYHGTPHEIKGKFDISKVGTGEGAQAYGHGMYFAENPSVATEYSKMLPAGGSQPSPRRTLGGVEVEPLTPEYKAAQLVEEMGLPKAKKFVKNWAKDPTPDQVEFVKGVQNSLLGINKKSDVKNLGTGNLYKVDIPDEYIPKMLDYEKTVDIANPAIKEAAKIVYDFRKAQGNARANVPFEEFAKKEFGKNSNLYDDLDLALGGADKASQFLAERGIPGIKYLDEGSRGMPYKVQVFDKNNKLDTENLFPTKEMAEMYMQQRNSQGFTTKFNEIDKKRTSNFVVFDPTDVQILEKNSKPVSRKELIEKQVKNLKD